MAERKPITKLLVANRGEIARRVFSTCRRMGIATVAVYSDADAGALHVADADEAVGLGGETAADSYLRADAVIAAARAAGADAVHPGYGFLAENAEFAKAVAEAGLTWVGPPPAAIKSMGSKVRARAMMEEAGVPVLPGAELDADSDIAAEGERVGYPLLVKASAGGGGKGMRSVSGPGELTAAVEGARREAESSFGDPTVFLERFLERPRHVEIQVFADSHGEVVHLGERECSIQRRHQKVVEESPSPAVDPELRERMGSAAVEAARAVDYEGAGTVEFLLGPDGEFFFLEMNTRLQVEHPVTELVTGLDLVRLQLLVAMGEALPVEARDVELTGSAVEVRLYAEDPASGFLPQTGEVVEFEFDPRGDSWTESFATPEPFVAEQPIRLDAAIDEGGGLISPHYDPMLAKVVAWAPTRAEAAGRLARALAGARICAPPNNRDFLVRTLRHPGFLSGATHTGFIEEHEGLTDPLIDGDGERHSAVAAALLLSSARPGDSAPLSSIPRGWRNNPGALPTRGFAAGDLEIEVGYRRGRDGLAVEVDGEPLEPVVEHGCIRYPDTGHSGLVGEIDLSIGGVRRRFAVSRSADTLWVDSPLGQARLSEAPRFPGSDLAAAEGALVAPMPGKVLELHVEEGQAIEAGALVAVLEAMKMEHELTAPGAGTVSELAVAVGDQVEAGRVLAVIGD